MKDLIFACLLDSGESEKDALRLARSIRTFGGGFCFNPIWMLSLQDETELSQATREGLFSLGVRLITFDLDPGKSKFPLADVVAAAGIAEGLAQAEASFLVMMAADTLVLQPPFEFILPVGKSLGACPVHLKLLGSGIEGPVDEFWSMIYRDCRVSPDKVFAMQTVADRQLIRAYFNSGLLVVRPERGLLRGWQSNFEHLYRQPEYEAFYQKPGHYNIFMHQMVLAGSILSLLTQEEFQQFPIEINYPLHLHSQVASAQRPKNLSQLITCRYEDYAELLSHPEFDRLTQFDEPLKAWLQAQK